MVPAEQKALLGVPKQTLTERGRLHTNTKGQWEIRKVSTNLHNDVQNIHLEQRGKLHQIIITIGLLFPLISINAQQLPSAFCGLPSSRKYTGASASHQNPMEEVGWVLFFLFYRGYKIYNPKPVAQWRQSQITDGRPSRSYPSFLRSLPASGLLVAQRLLLSS